MDDLSNNIKQGANAMTKKADGLFNDDAVSDQMLDTTSLTGTASQMTTDSSITGYKLAQDNQWGWITLYVVTIVIAVLGNLLFIVSCLCTKRTRTTGYYLLINLSIRDILLAGVCIPFTLDTEIINISWYINSLGEYYCYVYRYFYYCFLFMLPLTLLFLSYHLFVENCKWNFAGEEGVVPRPWPHTIYLPMIWFFSLLFATPAAYWWTEVRPKSDDFYRNDIQFDASLGVKQGIAIDAKACMHTDDLFYEQGSDFFYIASTLVTFCIPFILLFIPWWALLVQVCGCCTRKLRTSEFWLSIITIFMILFFEASRAPFELFNFHHILTQWGVTQPLLLKEFVDLPLGGEPYKAVMKWAVYAPALLHPLLYFTFSPEARHGAYILFSRMCSCCCNKSGQDVEVASDDEKGQMLANAEDQHHMHGHDGIDASNVPLQSKQEDEM